LWDDGSAAAIAGLQFLDDLCKKKEQQRQSRETTQLETKRKKEKKRTGVTYGWSTEVVVDDLSGG
jgi:hypothetical protein